MDLNDFIKFLEERPALNINKLEQEARIPQSLLGKILRGERNLTATYINRLIPVLKKYGYK